VYQVAVDPLMYHYAGQQNIKYFTNYPSSKNSNSYNSTSPKVAMLEIIWKQLSQLKGSKPNDQSLLASKKLRAAV
jgi:hypothetical protein